MPCVAAVVDFGAEKQGRPGVSVSFLPWKDKGRALVS
jgi:hypothetical protein